MWINEKLKDRIYKILNILKKNKNHTSHATPIERI